MTVLRARVVAEPVAVPPAARGKLLGGSPSAIYIEADGYVIAVTARAVPLMPNGISIDAAALPSVAPGEDAFLSSSEIKFADTVVHLEGASEWSPLVPSNAGRTAADVGRRGRGVLRNCRVAPASDPERLAESIADAGLAAAGEAEGRKGTVALLTALGARDPSRAAEASSLLLGRGGGLTPEGDDLVGGAAAAIVAFGSAAGLSAETRADLLRELCPPGLGQRTTALSATLLDLAARGLVVDPLLHVLHLQEPPDRWRPALHRLIAIGHTTGRAWALGCAAAAAMIGAPTARKESSA